MVLYYIIMFSSWYKGVIPLYPRGTWEYCHSASPRAIYPMYHLGQWYNPIIYHSRIYTSCAS